MKLMEKGILLVILKSQLEIEKAVNEEFKPLTIENVDEPVLKANRARLKEIIRQIEILKPTKK